MKKYGLGFIIILIILAIIAYLSNQNSGEQPPESETPPETVENPDRMVSISGSIKVQDYETFGDNEHSSGNFSRVVFVGNTQPQALENVPPPTVCAGDEIWPALDLTIKRINADGDVSIDLDGKLYEGTSCSTTDLDGTYSGSFTIPKDTTITKSFTMWNTSEDEPADKAEFTITVYNGTSP